MKPIKCLIVGLGLLLSGGCASRTVNIDNPIPIARTEYDRVFEASIRVLRDYQFVVERQDRRFGVITARPRAAASALEPWYIDNSTAYQTLDNTLNYDRRIVQVYLEKAPDEATADAEGSTAKQLAEVGGVQTDYQLRVDVQVERRQIPPTNLHTAAMTSVTNYGYQGSVRPIRTEAGYEASYWRPMGHDELFEKRLVAQILAVAGRIQPLHDTVTGGKGESPAGASGGSGSGGGGSPIERIEPGEVPAPPVELVPAPQPPAPNP